MARKRKPLTDREIGQRVRAARERTTMPQQHIANVMTMTRGHRWHQTVLAKVESGERALKLSEAVEVADILGVPLCQLTGEQPATDPASAKGARAIRELQMLHAKLGRVLDELEG